ncbi:MAG: phosphatidate cytidylyltransferase [Spirochaetes bacterium]|nr:phosphatidate cytidylyltransferase [Spirochaetota bacterium]
MNNIIVRLLLFFIGVPLLIALIVLVPDFNHAPIAAIVLAFTFGCSIELSRMMKTDIIFPKSALFHASAMLPPLAVYAASLVDPSSAPFAGLSAIALASMVSFSRFAFISSQEDIPGVLVSAAFTAFPVVYPGTGAAFVMMIIVATRAPTTAILWFIMIAFANDSLAWAVGMTFGRRRGIVAVSPNKSVAGFVSGMAGSLVCAFLGPVLFPAAIPFTPVALTMIGVLVGTADIIGDLFESALKRSSGIKDSGSIMPGRGGFLDSFDNVLFAAPVFLILVRIFGIL